MPPKNRPAVAVPCWTRWWKNSPTTAKSWKRPSRIGKPVRRRGIYLLPNLFTTSALFSGFFAVVCALNGEFANASIAIFVSMVLDGLDGRVARLTNTQSAFGAEYDSLADMLSFGVAPALVTFSWILQDVGKIGWIAAFVYVAGAALRLARFNVQIGSTDKKWFIGLPSPAAAALVAGCCGPCTTSTPRPSPSSR